MGRKTGRNRNGPLIIHEWGCRVRHLVLAQLVRVRQTERERERERRQGKEATYLAGGARAGVAVAGAAVAGAGRHGEEGWFKDESLESYKVVFVCLCKAWRNETDEEERKKRG